MEIYNGSKAELQEEQMFLFIDSNIHHTGKENSRRALAAWLYSVALHTEGVDPAMIKVSYTALNADLICSASSIWQWPFLALRAVGCMLRREAEAQF